MAAEFPAVPLVLDLKDPGRAHVVVGDSRAQVDFLREFLGGLAVAVEDIKTLDDLGLMHRLGIPGPFILVVPADRHVALASDVRKRVHIWSARPIKKHTAAIRALVKEGVRVLAVAEPDKELLDNICDRVIEQCGEDAPPSAMIWAATWILSETETPIGSGAWTNPWSDPWAWAKVDVLPQRLYVLYRDLVSWVYARVDDKAGIERMGCTPSKVKWLKTLILEEAKVDAALVLLSAWRATTGGDYQVALKIGRVFAKR